MAILARSNTECSGAAIAVARPQMAALMAKDCHGAFKRSSHDSS